MERMTHMAKDIESEPAWADHSLGVRLYDGSPFLTISVDVLPGIILVEFTNKNMVPLLWVSCAMTPIKGDAQVRSRWAPLTIASSDRLTVPIAYITGGSCECSLLVTFRRDIQGATGARLHVCQARVYLMPAPEGTLFSSSLWRTLASKLARREVTLPAEMNLSPPAVLDELRSFINGKLTPIAIVGSSDPSTSWGCIDPVFMVTFASSPGSSFVIQGFDTAVLDRIVAEFPRWGAASHSRDGDMFDLGVACTTLRDGLLLNAKADYVRPAGRQVARLAGILGLRVPLLSQLLDILTSRESLEDLSESERSLYGRALAEVETQVIGRPS
jgi:hypothetical protein